MPDLDDAFRQARRQRVRTGFAELGARLGSTEKDPDRPIPWKRGDPIDPESLAKLESGFREYSDPVVLSEAARRTFVKDGTT